VRRDKGRKQLGRPTALPFRQFVLRVADSQGNTPSRYPQAQAQEGNQRRPGSAAAPEDRLRPRLARAAEHHRPRRFNELNVDLFGRCVEAVERCLRDGEMGKRSVHGVVLGGAGRQSPGPTTRLGSSLIQVFEGEGARAEPPGQGGAVSEACPGSRCASASTPVAC